MGVEFVLTDPPDLRVLPGDRWSAGERFAKGAIPSSWGLPTGLQGRKKMGFHEESFRFPKFKGQLGLVIRPGEAAHPSPRATRSAQGRGSSSPPPERWRKPDDYFRSAGSARGGPERRGRIAPARKRARGPGRGKRQGASWSGDLAMHHHFHPGSDPATPGPDATESGARRCRRFGRCRRQWKNRATSTAAATRLRRGRRSCQRAECGLLSYSCCRASPCFRIAGVKSLRPTLDALAGKPWSYSAG